MLPRRDPFSLFPPFFFFLTRRDYGGYYEQLGWGTSLFFPFFSLFLVLYSVFISISGGACGHSSLPPPSFFFFFFPPQGRKRALKPRVSVAGRDCPVSLLFFFFFIHRVPFLLFIEWRLRSRSLPSFPPPFFFFFFPSPRRPRASLDAQTNVLQRNRGPPSPFFFPLFSPFPPPGFFYTGQEIGTDFSRAAAALGLPPFPFPFSLFSFPFPH